MGRAIRGTTVKAEGQAGPLGKGVPLTKAAGPGGLIDIAGGKRAVQSPQVPGFKGLMGRAMAAGKIRSPQQNLSPFAKFMKTGRARPRGIPMPRGAPGGLVSKPVLPKQGF